MTNLNPFDSQKENSLLNANAVRAGDILPAEYRIVPDREFFETFGNDPSAQPPSPIRIDYWWYTDGKAIMDARWREVDETNKKAVEAFERELAAINDKNRAIDARNLKREKAYQERRGWELRRFTDDRRRTLARRLKDRLNKTVESQEPMILECLASVRRIARLQMLTTPLFWIWIIVAAIYVVMTFVAPFSTLILGPIVLFLTRWTLNLHINRLSELKRQSPSGWEFYEIYVPYEYRHKGNVYTPLKFASVWDLSLDEANSLRERYPLAHGDDRERISETALGLLGHCFYMSMPGPNLLFLLLYGHQLLSEVLCVKQPIEAMKINWGRRDRFEVLLSAELERDHIQAMLDRRGKRVQKPEMEARLALPVKQSPISFSAPQPPAHCYDSTNEKSFSRVLRGPTVQSVEVNREYARYRMFSNNTVRAYFTYGNLPIPLAHSENVNMACIGTAGSGKTTLLRHLMSMLLPLPSSDVQAIADQSPHKSRRKPIVRHHWSRSFTHQAVIYNAKNENIPFLAAMGFDPASSLIILDPSDSRCFAPDVAKDIGDRDSIDRIAEAIVPIPAGDGQKDESWIWKRQARRIITASIVSFRNAAFQAGKVPDWTFWDLVNAVETPETLRAVLAHHDTPDAIMSQLCDLADAQASSIYMSATAYISQFKSVAQRWKEAARRGRVVSLKNWAKDGGQSVLVLPNYRDNPDVNGPLNQVFLKSLTDIFLKHEYSFVKDANGEERALKRIVVIDELGHAGYLSDLIRLMTEGREFGIQTILGIHQQSQIREIYGNNNAETILGLCPYLAFLKTGDPTTADYMSRRVGQQLTSYDKQQFSYGSTKGTAWSKQQTTSTSQGRSQNESTTRSSSDSESDTIGRSRQRSISPRHGNSFSVSDQESRTVGRSSSFSYTGGSGTHDTEGVSNSDGQSGSRSSNESKTYSTELREEAAILASEFMSLPDPVNAGAISGYFITPSMPVWKAEIPFEDLACEFVNPKCMQNVLKKVRWEDDEAVSKGTSWTEDDYRRLNLDQKGHLLDEPEDDTLDADFDE